MVLNSIPRGGGNLKAFEHQFGFRHKGDGFWHRLLRAPMSAFAPSTYNPRIAVRRVRAWAAGILEAGHPKRPRSGEDIGGRT